CDVIFANSKFFKKWHSNDEHRLYDVLRGFRKTVQKIIWFDTNDSTGTTQFNIMPFVDTYCKGQILKDRSLYNRNLYGLRVFTDYYKKLYNLSDNENAEDLENQKKSVAVLLSGEHAHKLRVSWNSAMNEWGSYDYKWGGLIAKIRSMLPLAASYTIKFEKAGKNRPIDINGRIGLSHLRNTVSHQRRVITEILKSRFSADVTKVNRGKYLKELQNSKIGISPFGLGEISCRDFEVIINGALLFKQDMSHLETWPPLYVNEETYAAFSWDLSDFENKLRGLLRDNEKIRRISENAQRTYKYYLYGDGRIEFCNKVMDILR
ncbi:MAG: glycosyltransferase, partial [Candidatus Omnitrophica bacterium]|nr:glycosyltransferase [Candidatus Omnitrophota bacterium]